MKKAKVGMKVIDRWYSFKISSAWGFGKITKLTNRSAYIKFNNLEEIKRYDKTHFENFIAIFNKKNLININVY